ncbi:hypothetical protein AB5N19_06096 [Seiridium cardinale]
MPERYKVDSPASRITHYRVILASDPVARIENANPRKLKKKKMRNSWRRVFSGLGSHEDPPSLVLSVNLELSLASPTLEIKPRLILAAFVAGSMLPDCADPLAQPTRAKLSRFKQLKVDKP